MKLEMQKISKELALSWRSRMWISRWEPVRFTACWEKTEQARPH